MLSLPRSKLEQLTADLIDRTTGPLKQALSDAELQEAQIDEVVLVGGQTRMPAVQESVRKFFGKEPHKGANPDEAIALGAAIQAGSLEGSVKNVLLLDVTFSAWCIESGENAVLMVPRGTTIPTSKTRAFLTNADQQTSALLCLCEGDHPTLGDNIGIKLLRVEGIPPSPAGKQLDATLEIDADQTIKFSVHARTGGRDARGWEVRPELQVRELPNPDARTILFRERPDLWLRPLPESKSQPAERRTDTGDEVETPKPSGRRATTSTAAAGTTRDNDDATAESSVKLLLSRYRLVRQVGSGGMAEVWEATDLRLGSRVAIKRLLRQSASDPEFVERFKREARAAASLEHPLIIKIIDYDIDEKTGEPIIVMEFVDGENLKSRIHRGQLSNDDICRIGAAVADGLQEAHAHGVIHRDVTPSNVLLSKRDEVKLVDFGIAAVLGLASLTQTGEVIGTTPYLAPERVLGASGTPLSDVYGLGALLYEMATGRAPFAGETHAAILQQILNADPVPPHVLNPEVSPGLEETILRALAKSPEERPPTAADVARRLRTPEAVNPWSKNSLPDAVTQSWEGNP